MGRDTVRTARAIRSQKFVSRWNGSNYPFRKICQLFERLALSIPKKLSAFGMPQEEQEKKKNKTNRKAKRGATTGLVTLEANGEAMSVDNDDDDKPPLHVFFDIEAMQDTGRHISNLLISETEHDDRPFRFKGEHYVLDFLEWLDTLTEEDTQPITVIAHNFQGYDGYFIADEYHKQH